MHPATRVGRVVCKRNVDFDLVKLCDHDALDIEAVELGLPNFSEIEIAHTKDYRNRTGIHSDEGELALFRRVRSAYGNFDTVRGEESPAVVGFRNVLTAAQSQDIEDVRHWISTWGTI